MKLAHIINVTEIDESKKSSYLHIAQPVTLRSMLIAQQKAIGVVDVDLVAIKHRNEIVEIPAGFKIAPDIEKYAWEYIPSLTNVHPRKPLPRLADILVGLYETPDADYFIYTNLDIGLSSNFYIQVKSIIENGYDAFCINRIDLPKVFKGITLNVNNIELLSSVPGKKHPGIDCFVFKSEILAHFELGNVYIGFPPIGQVLKTQIEKNSKNFAWFKSFAITYHIGNDQPWNNTSSLYYQENFNQAKGLYTKCL